MRQHQKGASYIAILIAIIGFAFLAKIAIAVWGPYWDDRVVDTQITELMQSSPKNIAPSKFVGQMSQRSGYEQCPRSKIRGNCSGHKC